MLRWIITTGVSTVVLNDNFLRIIILSHYVKLGGHLRKPVKEIRSQRESQTMNQKRENFPEIRCFKWFGSKIYKRQESQYSELTSIWFLFSR